MIPSKYQFLSTIEDLPKMVSASLQYLGLHEVVGKGSNPVILHMAATLGISNIYLDDDTSWCALYHNFLCSLTNKPLSGTSYTLLRAISFISWGTHVSPNEACLGDTLVFSRPGGSHVALYIAESKDTYHILGGNQSNSNCFIEIDKDRLVAARRFYHIAPPVSAKKYWVDASGTISSNES